MGFMPKKAFLQIHLNTLEFQIKLIISENKLISHMHIDLLHTGR